MAICISSCIVAISTGHWLSLKQVPVSTGQECTIAAGSSATSNALYDTSICNGSSSCSKFMWFMMATLIVYTVIQAAVMATVILFVHRDRVDRTLTTRVLVITFTNTALFGIGLFIEWIAFIYSLLHMPATVQWWCVGWSFILYGGAVLLNVIITTILMISTTSIKHSEQHAIKAFLDEHHLSLKQGNPMTPEKTVSRIMNMETNLDRHVALSMPAANAATPQPQRKLASSRQQQQQPAGKESPPPATRPLGRLTSTATTTLAPGQRQWTRISLTPADATTKV